MNTTKLEILNIAQSMIQLYGYHGFSYKDLSAKVGIKNASIHYYFPTKSDLVSAVIDHQLEEISTLAKPIIKNPGTLSEKCGGLLDCLLSLTFDDNLKMCLGGILAAEILSLPKTVQKDVQKFFTQLSVLLHETVKSCDDFDSDTFDMDTFVHTQLIQLEGALILTRVFNSNHYIECYRKSISQLSVRQ